MAEQTQESPTLETKPKEPEKTPNKSEEEIQALLATLEKVGVKSPQHIEGVVANAREFGNVSNLLGAERQRVADLERKLQELESRPAPKRDSLDYSEYEKGPAVDLENVIRKVVRGEDERKQRQMAEMQKMQLQSWNTVRNDKDYELVRDVWENKLRDPNFIFSINSGLTDPVREYGETVRDFYKGLAMQAKSVIEQARGSKSVVPPHMESGERGTGNLVSEGAGEEPEVLKRFNQIKQKAAKGGVLSSEEELELAKIATFGLFPTSPAPPPKRK